MAIQKKHPVSEYEMLRQIIHNECRHKPVIIEAGCHDGYLTPQFYSFSKKPPAHYFAFECDPRNIEKIEKNTRFPAGAELIRKAIGSVDGPIQFHQSSGTSAKGHEHHGASSIRAPKEVSIFTEIHFLEPVTVECITLDTFCREADIDQVDLIMADIQGAEKDLILGGAKMIPKTKFLYLEKCERELYEGMWLRDELVKNLPGFFVRAEWGCDILLERK